MDGTRHTPLQTILIALDIISIIEEPS